MAKEEPITQDQVRQGIDLCRTNSRRLAKCAKLQISDLKADAGLGYALWSLAVEELGKAEILQKCLTQGAPVFPVKLSRDHTEKFDMGLATIASTVELAKMSIEVVVSKNDSARTLTVAKDEDCLSISSRATGRFRDTTHGGAEGLTEKLRFKSLYVDFNDGHWRSPAEPLQLAGVEGKWDLAQDDVVQLIKSLLAYLDKGQDEAGSDY